MKVILTEDVKALGKAGDIVEINDGYARNFILKQKKGLEANSRNLNDLKLKKANEDKVAQEKYEAALALKQEIEAGKIQLAIKTGEGGKAFGSISSKEIAAEVKSQMNLEIDKKKVLLKDAIKTVGEHTVGIKLHPKVTADLKVSVAEE
ncbi:50S ribosomal protein L9 [Suipraeoptans intestinalis]|uniref:50S ribosomal protein L9 n=1 Tax=Suipraeoptans intestinalis TaxID=2606628 RepID=UPI0023F5051C|nr:50S ribosomal protein L9 [Suipraeoptans intestinalis]MDD7770065.1 50S ribosomal protein L9 [Suipraeoptans intestinalis]MDY3121779.1 50S ribosomal protein L9 [Suipraeoptans intestinalis]